MNCLNCLHFAICELVSDEKKVMTKWSELWQLNLIWEKASQHCGHYKGEADKKVVKCMICNQETTGREATENWNITGHNLWEFIVSEGGLI